MSQRICNVSLDQPDSVRMIDSTPALIEAGASQEKSRAAAKAIADYDSRFNKIESDLLVLKWMMGLILAGVLSLVMKAFF